MSNKPIVRDVDGNIFAIIGAVKSALRRAGQKDKAEEYWQKTEKAMQDGETDYNGMLRIATQYVEFELSEEEEDEENWDDEEEEDEE
jgi:hypothetical protein